LTRADLLVAFPYVSSPHSRARTLFYASSSAEDCCGIGQQLIHSPLCISFDNPGKCHTHGILIVLGDADSHSPLQSPLALSPPQVHARKRFRNGSASGDQVSLALSISSMLGASYLAGKPLVFMFILLRETHLLGRLWCRLDLMNAVTSRTAESPFHHGSAPGRSLRNRKVQYPP